MSSNTTTRFVPGDRVDFSDGTFRGMHGEVVGVTPLDRVSVTLTIFGRPVTIDVDEHLLGGPMLDEASYLACREPARLIGFLRLPRFTWSMRRVALFGCACLRRSWDLFDPQLRQEVEKTEEMVDRTRKRVAAGLIRAETAWSAWQRLDRSTFPWSDGPGQLIHDIFGNPFQGVTVDPVWLTRLGGVVSRLAQDIYHGRHWNEMPVLGDALEDAGCTDQVLLDHCRAGRTHARGCWLLDRLLSRR
jgi:hypothetical protein